MGLKTVVIDSYKGARRLEQYVDDFICENKLKKEDIVSMSYSIHVSSNYFQRSVAIMYEEIRS